MKILLGLMALLTGPSLALANAKVVGNAGKVVVCKNSEGQILSAEVLDLYEGRVLYKLNYTESPKNYIRQALKFVDKFAISIGTKRYGEGSLAADLKGIINRIQPLPPGTGLKPTQDSSEFITPKGCEVVQAVNYRTWDQIYMDSDIWNILSPTQKAALLLHETIYARLRYSGSEDDSDRARKMVAYVVSGAPLKPHTSLPKNSWRCLTENLAAGVDDKYTDFFVYPETDGSLVARFSKIYGHDVLVNTELRSQGGMISDWPLTQGQTLSFKGPLDSVVDSSVKAVIRMSDMSHGEVSFRGVDNSDKMITQKFECSPWAQH